MKELLTREVSQCQAVLETQFEELGKVYSGLMRDISSKASKAESIIAEYRARLQNAQGTSITAVVKDLQKSVEQLSQHLINIDNELGEAIAFLGENLEKFHEVEDNINEIKEHSEMMELMALNSMVVAIKAGSKGGGFTYITEVLRRNASSTKNLTDELQDLGLQLKSNLGELHNHMSDLNLQRKELEQRERDIQQDFQVFHQDIRSFIDFLDDMSVQSAQVRREVLNITEKVSHQDIYRQSLDHISLLVQELRESSSTEDEALLDQLSYVKFLGEFSLPLIDEIKGKLGDNIQHFDRETRGVEDHLEKIEKKRQSYLTSISNNLFHSVEDIQNSLDRIIKDSHRFIKDIEGISMVNRGIVDRVNNLQERNSRFEHIIKAFRNVIIMGRIEVTKQDALRGVEVSVNDIARITDAIDVKVQESSEAIDGVLGMNHHIVGKLQDLRKHLYDFMHHFEGSIAHFKESQVKGSRLFSETMEQLCLCPRTMQKSFVKALESSSALKELTTAMNQLGESLEGELDSASRERDEILSRLGLEKWEIRNENINRVVEQFTIRHHKSAAKQLVGQGGQNPEESGDSSSVVLF